MKYTSTSLTYGINVCTLIFQLLYLCMHIWSLFCLNFVGLVLTNVMCKHSFCLLIFCLKYVYLCQYQLRLLIFCDILFEIRVFVIIGMLVNKINQYLVCQCMLSLSNISSCVSLFPRRAIHNKLHVEGNLKKTLSHMMVVLCTILISVMVIDKRAFYPNIVPVFQLFCI